MYLVQEAFNDVPKQSFTIRTATRVHIHRVAIWVFISSLSGTESFKFDIVKDSGVTVFTKTMTAAQIKTSIGCTGTYGHGKLFIDLGYDFQLDRGRYQMIGYQQTGYSVSTFAAWCKDWESVYQPVSSAPTGDWQDPFYLRLYNKEGKQL